jgi:hypothetical protein
MYEEGTTTKTADHDSVTAAAFDIMRSIRDDLAIVDVELGFVQDWAGRRPLENPHAREPSQAGSAGLQRVIRLPESCSTMHIREKT